MVSPPRPTALTIAGVVEEVARATPQHPAILYRGETVRYAELRDAAQAVAKSLLSQGIRRGDRVGVLLGNQPEWVIAAIGAAYVGAIFVPLNTWYKRNEIAWTLQHCGLSCLIAVPRFLNQDFAAMLQAILPQMRHCEAGALNEPDFPRLKSVVLLGEKRPGSFTWDEFLRIGASQSDGQVRAALAAVHPSDPAYILYTSGSTAEPKGVMLAHGGVISNCYEMGARRDIDATDRVWLGSPLFYGLGATNALPITLTHGATLVLQGHFEAGMAIDLIEGTQATVYYATGNMSRAILDHPDYRQSRIGSLSKGNAGTMTEYKRLTLVEMGIHRACPAYGLTESYGNATVGYADDPLKAKLHTNGHPLPGMEVSIVDPDSGRTLKAGETGLILLRGHTTPGYFRNDAENARALRPDGFLDTGDLGSLDADGRLIFHARLKEMIKTGGINVSPLEIEQLLVKHPHVVDAHVIGLPHMVSGELVVAFVVADAAVTEQEMREYVRERAASFKVPRHVLFRSHAQLPRVASGKVAKYRLLEEARSELGS